MTGGLAAPSARRSPRCSRRKDDRGLVLVMFGLILTFLLVLVAMAIDLGQARFSKRQEQAASDLAALDAGYYLAGKATPGVTQPAKACEAAALSVRRNVDAMTSVTPLEIATKCAVLPPTSATCNAASPVNVSFAGGDYSLIIRYPVPVSELDTSRFAGGGVADGTDGCRRMRVTLGKTESTRFATVIGIDDVSTEASAVVHATVSNTSMLAPAFLVLERTACGSLANSANGAGNLGIIVEADGADPGIIHSDSDATTNCSGNTTDAYAIYGSPLSSGAPSITAGAGSAGAPGIIQTRATNGKGGATFPGGLSVAPSNGGILSRKVMDTKYNSGSSTAITALHATASAAVRATGTPAGHAVMGCNGPVPLLATKVYVDCASVNSTATFVGVTSVVFSGDVDLKQNNELIFPDATTVVVRGSLELPKGRFVAPSASDFFVGGGVVVANNSGLAVNTPTEASCTGRVPPAVWPKTTRMAVFGGNPAFDVAGTAALCQTTLYLAGPKTLTGYAVQQVSSGGTCTALLPCPKTSGNAAEGAEFAVSGAVTLIAPNQHTTSAPATQGLEDLALWTEGDGTSEIKSGGDVRGSGVHFFPNGALEMRSPATGNPRDAQFFARKAFLFQGTLRLKPDKNNAVTVPVAGDFGLIR